MRGCCAPYDAQESIGKQRSRGANHTVHKQQLNSISISAYMDLGHRKEYLVMGKFQFTQSVLFIDSIHVPSSGVYMWEIPKTIAHVCPH